MDKYLLYTKYFHGERNCPFDDHDRMCFWSSERRYCYLEHHEKFENEEYIKSMSECAPEIRHITENKNAPLELRAMVAWMIDDISFHSPMTDTSYFSNYAKDIEYPI